MDGTKILSGSYRENGLWEGLEIGRALENLIQWGHNRGLIIKVTLNFNSLNT